MLRQAVKLNPDMAQIHGNLGRGLTDTAGFRRGATPLRRGGAVGPEGSPLSPATGPVGRCPRPLGRGRGASEAGPALAPSDGVIETNLAKCLADQQQLDEAIDRLQDVVRRDPKFTEARQRLATVLATAGRYQEAAARPASWRCALCRTRGRACCWG